MINTVSYFSLDSFESVKPAAGDSAEFAIASGFDALMSLPAPVNASIKAASPEDPAEISIFSPTDPEPGSSESPTGRFFSDRSAEGTTVPQPETNSLPAGLPTGPTVSTPGGFCYDGTPWHPILKKDYGMDIISNRRQITDAPVSTVRLPPIENPVSNDAPRDPAKKDDFGIQVMTDGRPIVDPTVPVRLPPVEPGSPTKPDVKAAPVKTPYNPGVQNLPLQENLRDEGNTRDPNGKKDYTLGVFTNIRPIMDTTATPVRLPPVDPASTTKPDIKSAPVRLPPHEAPWNDDSTRDPNDMKKFNLGIFNRLRSITSAGPSIDQPLATTRVAGPERADQPDVQANVAIAAPATPTDNVEPGLPATIGEFHLPQDFEIGPGSPESLPATSPEPAMGSTPAPEAQQEETPLLVRPRPAIDPVLTAKLVSPEPVSTATPVKLPTRNGLWDDGNTRDPNEMKKFNLGILNRLRPVTDPKASQTADLTDVATVQMAPASREAAVAAIRANKWLEQLTGQKLPQPVVPRSSNGQVDDVEPGPPVVLDELQTPANALKAAGNSNIDVLPVADAAPEETPLLVRPRPISDPAAGAEKPLLRQPFQPVKTNGTGVGEKNDHPASFVQFFQEVSGSFGSALNEKAPAGGHSTLKSVVAGTEDIINEIGGRATLKSVVAGTADIINEIGGYLTEAEIVPETEIKADALDLMDVQFEKLWRPEPVGNKEIKMDAGSLTLQDAKEILDQVKPGLLELAALTAKKNEKQSMKMRLHPAELGAVEISLERNSSGALSAHFITENEGARQALTNNLDQLRDSLQKSGWQVGQLDVSSNPSSSTADQNREHRSRQNEVVGGQTFDHRSDKPEDLEQDSSSRLLNLRA